MVTRGFILLRIKQLGYHPDSGALFEGIRDMPWPVFLDSGRTRVNGARFDILAADPTMRFTTRGAKTEIHSRAGKTVSERDPLALLDEYLGGAREPASGLPFSGGVIGYFGYDLGRRYEAIQETAQADIQMPELAAGIYDWAVVVDHANGSSWLVSHCRDPRTAEQWGWLSRRLSICKPRRCGPFEVLTRVRANLSRAGYGHAFARAKQHIRSGDVYQVNLTQRFEAEARGDAWRAYCKLRDLSPAPFSSYLDYPFGQILSASPERFLSVRSGHVETKPIKGTRPRHIDPARDARLAAELERSAKDKAENVMIVDLLRNDLGKSCAPGSVKATKLFDIEHFSNVHHMVSTVEGELAAGRTPLDLLRGCFPGGSITGAPKVRAMQVIESLEPQRRSVYCGAIGYVGYDGNMDTNIAIRTLLITGGHIYAWAGGGVVADSDEDAEYQECLDKASALLEILTAAEVSAAG